MGLVRLGSYYARRHGRLVNLDNYYITMYITIGKGLLDRIKDVSFIEANDITIDNFLECLEDLNEKYTK